MKGGGQRRIFEARQLAVCACSSHGGRAVVWGQEPGQLEVMSLPAGLGSEEGVMQQQHMREGTVAAWGSGRTN